MSTLKEFQIKHIVQQAFLKFLKYSPWKGQWHELPAKTVLSSYFTSTVRNLFYDYLKVELSRPDSIEELPEETLVEHLLPTSELDDFIEHLDPLEQQLLDHRLKGYSLGHSASLLGLTYSDAGVKFHRMKKKLKRIKEK